MKNKNRASKKNSKNAMPVQSPEPSSDLWHIRIICGLSLAGFLVYANTLGASFHFDDLAVIVNNPAVRNPWDLQGLFDAFNTRVLPGWTFAVNYALGRLDVAGYHFVNIWFHVCNAVLVYALSHQILSLGGSSRLSGRRIRLLTAFGAAAIFLLHPLATQPVNYIWQRATLMMTFFYLAATVLFLEFRLKQVWWMFSASLIACFGAMLCKESAFALPLMLIAMDWMFSRPVLWPDDRRRIGQWLCLIALMAIIPLLLSRTEHVSVGLMRPYSLTQGVSESVMSRVDYQLAQVNVLLTYLRLYLFPVGQTVDHDYPLVSQSGWVGWSLAIATHLGVLWCGIYFFNRNRLITWAVVWFYLNAALESMVPSRDLCVEHRMYLPMIGLCLVLAHGVIRITGAKTKPLIAIFTILAIVWGTLTLQRNAVWHDDLSLWSDAVKKSPRKARPYNNRGQALRKIGQIGPAMDDFNRAIALDPGAPAAYQNRGHLFKMIGDLDRAISDYSTVIRLETGNAQAYASRGNIYKRRGDFTAALDDYSKAVSLDNANSELYTNRAFLWEMTGRTIEALGDYEQALKINPRYAYALSNRGNLNVKLKRYDLAVKDYTDAIEIDPAFAQAYANRAAANFYLGHLQQARSDAQTAVQMGQPLSDEFLRQLGKQKNP